MSKVNINGIEGMKTTNKKNPGWQENTLSLTIPFHIIQNHVLDGTHTNKQTYGRMYPVSDAITRSLNSLHVSKHERIFQPVGS